MQEIVNLVLTAASDSFIGVTVFVGAALVLVGYINYKTEGSLIESIKRKKRWQPLIGALLGLIPGCGGAILIMPLYTKRTVTFGAVIATLIATTGDAAFVLISKVPLDFLKVSAIAFITAIIAGYTIDHFKFDLKKSQKLETSHPDHKSHNMKHIGHAEGDAIDIALHHKTKGHEPRGTLGYKITHQGYIVYIGILIIGLIFGTIALLGVKLSPFAAALGIAGTLLSIILMIAGKKYLQADTHEEEELKLMSIRSTIIHNSEETAFIGAWVFVAYLAHELLMQYAGAGMTGEMASAGIAAIVIGALVGLIPGCGPQIIFVSLYSKGMLPFAALIAHAISQDGDALFPLLAMDKKAAIVASVITTVVAFAVGFGWYLIG